METKKPEPVKIFYCYARKDEVLLNELLTHVAPLERLVPITQWSDRYIEPGQDWEHEIAENLDTADVILLLISPDFLASKYAYEKEMKSAIEAHERNLARVIPIIVRHCNWKKESFSKLQVLPKDGEPVTSKQWPNHDVVWDNVSQEITSVVQKLFGKDRSERTFKYLQDTYDKAYDNPHLFEFLKWKYVETMYILDELLVRGGQKYPVAVYQASDEQMRDPESVLLLPLDENRPSDEDSAPPSDQDKYRKFRLRAGGRVDDDETFTMKEFRTRNPLGFQCQLGGYARMMDTCESLEWELLDQAKQLTSSDDKEAFKAFDRKLRQRSAFHAKVADPIRDGRLRSVALSISTLIL